ncbi:MAG: hypothetical protein IIC54_00585 [Proteobacteria bacterium]|nr:hypothetical protein [Pseudomonadota bacterium]
MLEVNRELVRTPKDLEKAIEDSSSDRPILFRFQRVRDIHVSSIPMEEEIES